MSNSDNKRARNWLLRLKNLKLRSPSTENKPNEEERHSYHASALHSNNPTQYPRSRNNFRRSIIKMHTRVKNAFRQKNNRNTLRSSNATTSDAESRVTLHSPVKQIENIYTTKPFKNASEAQQEVQNQVIPNPIPRLPEITQFLIENVESSTSTAAPMIPPRVKRNFPQLSIVQNGRSPKNEIASLSNFYWYWGPISRVQAEERLKDSPDGAFLVRDSTSDRYLFTLSFRSVGKILHTRIEFSKSGYSLADQAGYHSVAELIGHAIAISKDSIYCYTTVKDDVLPNFPVRLTLPVSRYEKVPTLKYLARFVIRQYVIINDMEKLPLPVPLIKYLQESGQYF